LQWWLSQAPTQAFREKGGFQTPFLMSKKSLPTTAIIQLRLCKAKLFSQEKIPTII
jgi:hypothetical protein